MIKLILPLVLIVGIIGGVFLVQNRVNLFPRAAGSAFQEQVVVSNQAPTSLTISYFTVSPSDDFIQYGENTDVPNLAVDIRGSGPKMTHYFNLQELKPNTKYYFKVNTGGKLMPENEYLTFQTSSDIGGQANIKTFNGTVKKEGGEIPSEGIVFLSSDQTQLLSAPIEGDGRWSIAFSGIRSADLSNYVNIEDVEQIHFIAYGGMDGFGLFGEYALKKDAIDIKLSDGALPFYRINLGQQGIGGEGQDPNQEDKTTLWVRVQDFLKGAF